MAAPRRRRSPRPVRPDRWWIGGIGVLVLLLGAMAIGPRADLTAAQSRVEALEAQQSELDVAVEALESEAARLQDPAALEDKAREDLGMARPGEIPYIVTNPSEAAPAPVRPAADAQAEPGPQSLVDRVIGFVRGLAR